MADRGVSLSVLTLWDKLQFFKERQAVSLAKTLSFRYNILITVFLGFLTPFRKDSLIYGNFKYTNLSSGKYT